MPDFSNDPAASQDQTSPIASPASDAQPSQVVSNTPQPATPSPQGTATPAIGNGQPSASPNAPTGSISNQPPASAPQIHPSVQRAGILSQVAQALSGGPRYQVSIDPTTGVTTRTPVPLSKGQIALALATEVLSGSLAGLSQVGPGSVGRAGSQAFQQNLQQTQQRNAQAQNQAEEDAKNRASTLAGNAQAFELNSRTLLNTAQAERMGLDNLKDAVSQNSQLLSDYSDAGAVQESNISQDALMAGLKTGDYDATKQIAIPDGWTSINGRPEQTFSVVSSPSAKVPVTNAQLQAFAAAHVPGYQAYKDGKVKTADGVMLSGTILADANAKMQANKLMFQEVGDVKNALLKSSDKTTQDLGNQIPDFKELLDDPTRGGQPLASALQRFQKYVSHTDVHNLDLFQSLGMMAQQSKPSSQDPKKTVPNPDAPFAQTIAGAFGNGDPSKGWQILKSYSQEITPQPIKDESEAASLIANNAPNSKAYRTAKLWLQTNQTAKANLAGAEERAKKAAEGAGAPGAGNAALINPTGTGVNTAYLQSLPPDQRNLVQGIGEGRIDAPNTRTKQGEALAQLVSNTYPDYDATKFPTYKAMQKDFTSGKTSQGLLALNTALSHLGVVFDNAKASATLPGVAWVERQTGAKAAVQLHDAQQAVSDELGRAYKSGVLTESERSEWKDLISGWTPANVKANAQGFARLLDGKISAYEQQLRNGAPSGAVKLPALMSPQAADSYQRITGERPTTSVGTNSASVGVPQGKQVQIPTGATLARDGKGNVVGYVLNGQYQGVQ